MSDIVHVAVAVILNESNEVCISLRHQHAHQGGLWEFPGGKVQSHETVEQALNREIAEELGLMVERSSPFITVSHHYADKKVCLHVRKVLAYKGYARGVEGQPVKWLPLSQLSSDDFPAASQPIIQALLLPERYLITGGFTGHHDFVCSLEAALEHGIRLVQLRLKNDSLNNLTSVQRQHLVAAAAQSCNRYGAALMLNIADSYLRDMDLTQIKFSGFHVDSKTLMTLSQRLPGSLFSASCHCREELLQAEKLSADFVVLSPLQRTASHPEQQGMGWQQFADIVESISIPVFALGGLSDDDLETARLSGAQGVAAISAFWKTKTGC